MVRLGVYMNVAVKTHCFRFTHVNSLKAVFRNNSTNCLYQLYNVYSSVTQTVLHLHYIPHSECLDFIHDVHYMQLWEPLLLNVQHLPV